MSQRASARALERAALLKRSRQARWRERVFFVEGVRAIDRVRSRAFEVEAWLHAEGGKLSGWAREILTAAPAETRCPLPAGAMKTLSDKDGGSELLALVAMPATDPARIPIAERLLVVVVDRPSSPGNLGALLRSCDAFGVDGVLVAGHACDLFDPRTVRASAGSLFSVPAVPVPGPREVAAWIEAVRARHGETLVLGSSARADRGLDQVEIGLRTVLVLGNETRGMSAAMGALCDEVIAIPMTGDATSLNLASAAAILLHGLHRRRVAML